MPSPQQQQSSATVKLKKEKEKKKPLIPFHQRPSVERDVPEVLRTHVAMATKGVPTANVLTSVNQKRHINVAAVAAAHKTKKHGWPNQTSFSKSLYGLGSQQIESKLNDNSSLTTLSSNVSSMLGKADTLADTSLLQVNTSNNAAATARGSKIKTEPGTNSLESFSLPLASKKDPKSLYELPVLGTFALPSLPDDPLDCRLFERPSPASPAALISPLTSQFSPVWEV